MPRPDTAAADYATGRRHGVALTFAEALAELLGDDSRCDLAIGNATVRTADAIAPCTMLDEPAIGIELSDGRRFLLTVEAVDDDVDPA